MIKNSTMVGKTMRYGLLWLCLWWSQAMWAQKTETPLIEGELLVQVRDSSIIDAILSKYPMVEQAFCVAPSFQIWRLSVRPAATAMALLPELNGLTGVVAAQAHHRVEARAVRPNDTRYSDQWHLNNTGANGGLVGADVKAEAAWNLAKGGTTIDGDTIVIAVVDDGILLSHPDLVANIFVNRQEIPQNNLDDDNNGYVDDINGWNTTFQNNQVGQGGHGVEVSGVIGAVGNNNRGVSGINWQVKLLPLVKDGTEASILAAYDYAYTMRRLYNETNGQRGAFIVATNNSFGLSGFFGVDAPIWCSLYDKMGSVGILSVAAAPNSPVNIDVVGDLPSTCPSSSLLVVTSTNNRDLKATDAGFGVVHVDLGAPGVGIWTTSATGDYTAKNGTSLACPIVSGLVGLAYNMPCPNFINKAKTEPAAAVLLLRDWILRGGDANADLNNRSSSGRRVNAFGTLNLVQDYCSGCVQPARLRLVADTQSLQLSYTAVNQDSVRFEYRQLGQTTWQQRSSNRSPLVVGGLAPCQSYECRVVAFCGNTPSPIWTQTIKTDGCCGAPQNFYLQNINNQSFTINFSPITSAIGYDICLKETASSTCQWTTRLRDTQFIAQNLGSCQTYSVRVQPICPNRVGGDTTLWVKTKGCGICYEGNYCAPGATTANEWIDSFFIHNSRFASGKSNGYRRFDTVIATLEWGQTYDIGLKPGYPSVAYQEAARVWIDYNQDGDFDDVGEVVYENTRFNSRVSGRFTVPQGGQNGTTRLRVGMRYVGSTGGLPPTPCELVSVGGEFEDYCVALTTRVGIPPPSTIPEPLVYPNPFETYSVIDNSQSHLDIVSVALVGLDGRLIFEKKNDLESPLLTLDWPQHLAHGLYFIQIKHRKGVLTYKVNRL